MDLKQSLLLLVLLAAASPALCAHTDLSEKYPLRSELHEKYILYWTFDKASENITFAVRVQTTGWVGFGVSPNGQMPQSDVVIGWVDGTGNSFQDRFATGRSTPPVDPVQNWFLISAEEEDGYTTLEFTRNFTTCDSRDRPIKAETAYVVWAWRDDDPVDGTPLQHTVMGFAPLNLLGQLVDAPTVPEGARNFSIRVNNVVIPAVDTTYWCAALRYPEEIVGQTQYIIKFGPLLSEESLPYVHHITVHLCDTLDGVTLDQGGPCNSVDSRIAACRSGPTLGGWAVGGAGFVYPANIAEPIGGPVTTGKGQYIVMEMHYNNPGMASGVVDSSGMYYTYISTPRQYDSAILSIGHIVAPSMIIPPETENFTITSVCPTSCTERGIPESGIKVFANLLHTHLAGIGLEISVLRRYNECRTSRYEEIEVVDRNLQYDFNFQQYTHLPKEITIMPGDTLLMRCYYRTKGRSGVTLGGLATSDEMCLSFLNYYPKTNFSACISIPSYNQFTNFVREQVPFGQWGTFGQLDIRNPDTFKNTFNQLSWTDEQKKALQDNLYSEGTQQVVCRIRNHGNESEFTVTENYNPEICCPREEPNECTRTTPTPCCDRECPAIREVVSGVATIVTQTSVLVSLFLIALLVAVM